MSKNKKFNPIRKDMEKTDPTDYYEESPWSVHWRWDMVLVGQDDNHPRIEEVNRHRPQSLKGKYWALGDLSILDGDPLVYIGSRSWFEFRAKDEVQRVVEVGLEVEKAGAVPFHGNNKGAEKRMAWELRRTKKKQVMMPFYGVGTFKQKHGKELAKSVDIGDTLILSPFAPYDAWSNDAQVKRTRHMGDLADLFLGVVVTPESMTGFACRYALNSTKKPVYLLEPFEGLNNRCINGFEVFCKMGAIPYKIEDVKDIIAAKKAGEIWTP